jgi:hypothetical protein
MIISTADKGVNSRIRAAAKSSGYSESIINTNVIPSPILKMGLEEKMPVVATFKASAVHLIPRGE